MKVPEMFYNILRFICLGFFRGFVLCLGIIILTANVTNANEISFRITSVVGYDGVNQSQSYTGAWVRINQAQINEKRIGTPNFAFEISGEHGQSVQSIGLSSARTLSNIDPVFANRTNDLNLGNRFWINRHALESGRLAQLVRSLSRDDQEVVYAICSILSDRNNVADFIKRAIRSRAGDSVYQAYWRGGSRVSELTAIARRCFNQISTVVDVAPARVSSTTPTPDQVRAAQTILAEMGLYTLAIDGVSGPGTQRALEAAMRIFESDRPANVGNFMAEFRSRLSASQETRPPEQDSLIVSLRADNSTLSENLVALEAKNDELAASLSNTEAKVAELEALHEERESIIRQLSAANATITDLRAGEVENHERLENLQRQLSAASETTAELREELQRLRPFEQELEVLREERESISRQLNAANATIADLREGIEKDERVQNLQRQLATANDTIVNLESSIENNFVPEEEYAALQRQIGALSATNSEIRERIDRDFVSRDKLNEVISERREMEVNLRAQVAAGNQTVAELRERMQTLFVPLAEHNELQRQLASAGQSVTDLREKLENDYVPLATYREAQRVISASNETIADLRQSISEEYIDLASFEGLQRQISALNETILELQERNQIQRNRMIESEVLFRNFRDDCAQVPECASAMRLD